MNLLAVHVDMDVLRLLGPVQAGLEAHVAVPGCPTPPAICAGVALHGGGERGMLTLDAEHQALDHVHAEPRHHRRWGVNAQSVGDDAEVMVFEPGGDEVLKRCAHAGDAALQPGDEISAGAEQPLVGP